MRTDGLVYQMKNSGGAREDSDDENLVAGRLELGNVVRQVHFVEPPLHRPFLLPVFRRELTLRPN